MFKRFRHWKKTLVVGLISGSVLLQTGACTDEAIYATAISSIVSAGGVWFIVDRILNE